MYREVQLWCKPDVRAGKSSQVGDCPFTHTAAMRLKAKGINFSFHVCATADKPEWLLANPHNGVLPCLKYRYIVEEEKEIIVTDSALICHHIDEVMTTEQEGGDKCDPNLRDEAWAIVENLGFFRAFAMYMKSSAENRSERRAALQERCDHLQSLLEKQEYPLTSPPSVASSPRYFLKGGMSQVDCTLVPQLFMYRAVCEHFTHETFESLAAGSTRAHLQAYISCMLDGDGREGEGRGEEVFSSTLMYDKESAIAGWGEKVSVFE